MNYFQMIAEQNIERIRREKEAEQKSREANDKRIHDILLHRDWTEDDFSVRKNRGNVESFNIHTGEILYTYPNCEEFTVTEAWRDIRDEFRGN